MLSVLTDEPSRAELACDLEVGRLELHFALMRRPRSGTNRKAELRFLRSLGDRFCPWLSAASPAVTDPARTERSVRPVAVPTCFGPWSTRPRRSGLGEAGRTRCPGGCEAGGRRGPAHWRRGRGSARKPRRRRGSGPVGGWPRRPPPPLGCWAAAPSPLTLLRCPLGLEEGGVNGASDCVL
jgi:hypothetical protein